jgi:hypothetical protein
MLDVRDARLSAITSAGLASSDTVPFLITLVECVLVFSASDSLTSASRENRSTLDDVMAVLRQFHKCVAVIARK